MVLYVKMRAEDVLSAKKAAGMDTEGQGRCIL